MWVPYYSKSFKQRKLINHRKIKKHKNYLYSHHSRPHSRMRMPSWRVTTFPSTRGSAFLLDQEQLAAAVQRAVLLRREKVHKVQSPGAGRGWKNLAARDSGELGHRRPLFCEAWRRQGDQRQDFFTVAWMLLWLPVTRVPFKFCFLSGNLVQSQGKCCPQYPKVNQILAGGWGHFFFAVGGCKANSLSFLGCGGSLWALSEWLPRKIQSPGFYPHSRPTQP